MRKSGNIQGNEIPILLLADDGKMERLLRANNANGNLQMRSSVLDGIVDLGRHRFELIMLNVEKTGYQTAEAVRSIKNIAPDCEILLYGPAYGETYAHRALQEGARDFLVWPIPLEELRCYIAKQRINNQQNSNRYEDGLQSGGEGASEDADERVCQEENEDNRVEESGDASVKTSGDTGEDINGNAGKEVSGDINRDTRCVSEEGIRVGVCGDYQKRDLLYALQELTLLVCKGTDVFVREAQKKLADALGRQWVLIEPKVGGEIVLGPVREQCEDIETNGDLLKGEIDQASIDAAINHVKNLLYLAHRDERLRRLVMTDGLTGAHNRRYIETFTRILLEQGKNDKNNRAQLTLLLFDIDNFKHYNDTYGHMAGDEILRESIRMIKRCCREHDIVARVGGDEFAVLFWDKDYPGGQGDAGDLQGEGDSTNKRRWRTHPETVMFLSNRIRRLMQTNEFPSLGSEARGVLTISGGLARYPVDGKTFSELIARADEALLAAKRSGKNHIYIVGQPESSQQ